MMKLAISGKGGVGKTTFTALLAQVYANKGRQVLAIDTDPSPCLAEALGVPPDLRRQLSPIAEMSELIEERTGAKPGTVGGFFTINPRVDDIPERFSVTHRGVRLLEMGGVQMGGSGCICPESAMLHTLFVHLLLRPEDIVLFDMYAGVEHLGRATVDFVDALLIVTEPTRASLRTAFQIRKLATDIGVRQIWLVGNKIKDDIDMAFLEDNAAELSVLGMLRDDSRVRLADRSHIPVHDQVPKLRYSTELIAEMLLGKLANAERTPQ
jgi:CO dehydrogenase maturation factor